MKFIKPLFVICTFLLITACGGGTRVVSPPHVDVIVDHPPELEEFHILDSFLVSTEDRDFTETLIDPYTDNGVFDIYWYVDSEYDYIVEYFINDIPSMAGSRFIDAELCGVGLPCDNYEGAGFCQYYTDFSISCAVETPAYSDVDSIAEPVYIDDLIVTVPQTLYFILQVCDAETLECEYDYRPMTML